MYVVLLSKSMEDIKYMIGRIEYTTYKYFAEILFNPCSTGAWSNRPWGIWFSNISEMDEERDRAVMFHEFSNPHVLLVEMLFHHWNVYDILTIWRHMTSYCHKKNKKNLTWQCCQIMKNYHISAQGHDREANWVLFTMYLYPGMH